MDQLKQLQHLSLVNKVTTGVYTVTGQSACILPTLTKIRLPLALWELLAWLTTCAEPLQSLRTIWAYLRRLWQSSL